MCGSNEANVLTFNAVHSRCCCPLYHVITLDRHCVCRTVSISIQCRGVGRVSCEVAVKVWTSGFGSCTCTDHWRKLCYSRLCTMLNRKYEFTPICAVTSKIASYVRIVRSVWACELLGGERGVIWFYEGVKDPVWKDGVVVV